MAQVKTEIAKQAKKKIKKNNNNNNNNGRIRIIQDIDIGNTIKHL